MNFADFYKDTLNSNLAEILNAIVKSSIQIEQKVRRSALDGIQGTIDDSACNSSGDVQKKLDVITNDIMIENLTKTKCCSVLLSEENDDAIIVDKEFQGKYMVAFDPLDGSSNIDCNVCIGTIFSVYEESEVYDFTRNGKDIICAGYVLYGPATELVITVDGKNGVQKFTLDNSTYIYTGEVDISNKTKKIYSINESNCENWYQDIKEYISLYKEKNTSYTQRYIGSMVADVHRTLLYGGVFCYPADSKNVNGKLRVIYECFPISKIMEQAGGASIIGNFSRKRILDIVPEKIHQRTPILMGSKDEVLKYIRTTRKILLDRCLNKNNNNINNLEEHYLEENIEFS